MKFTEKLKTWSLDFVYCILGSALVGAALSVFTVPNDIAPGGVSGLATALAYISPVSVGAWTLLLNVPLLLGAWRLLGGRTLLLTLVTTALLSLFIDLSGLLLPAYTGNRLLGAFFGGGISGFGMGLLFIHGISTGGTDLLALMLRRRFPNVNTGTLLLFVDAAVVLIAMAIFKDIEVALYSAIAIMVASRVIDALAEGVDYAKVIYIVTGKGEEMAKMLNERTDRGCTLIPAYGGYTGGSKQIILTVTRRNVLAQTIKLIKQLDPAAFTFVTDSTEVHGEGFKVD